MSILSWLVDLGLTALILSSTKGNNSVKIVGGFIVLNFCTSDALYLYQNLPKYLKGYQSYSGIY